MDYFEFIEQFMKESEKRETDRIFKTIIGLKSLNNE